MILTLLASRLARKGYAFIHGNEAPECKECRLKNTCVKNLTMGRRYTVRDVRRITHTCPLCGEVTLVEVEESDIPFITESSKAFEGITLTFHTACDSCRSTEKCRPVGLREGDRITITRVVGKFTCPKGQMTEVRVKRT
jgi:uncharacterized protein (UPF0179 family)